MSDQTPNPAVSVPVQAEVVPVATPKSAAPSKTEVVPTQAGNIHVHLPSQQAPVAAPSVVPDTEKLQEKIQAEFKAALEKEKLETEEALKKIKAGYEAEINKIREERKQAELEAYRQLQITKLGINFPEVLSKATTVEEVDKLATEQAEKEKKMIADALTAAQKDAIKANTAITGTSGGSTKFQEKKGEELDKMSDSELKAYTRELQRSYAQTA